MFFLLKKDVCTRDAIHLDVIGMHPKGPGCMTERRWY